MQVEVQDYLRLVEAAGTLLFVDIEATGLRGDYNSVLVVSVKPYQQTAKSFVVKAVGNDVKVVKEAKAALEAADCWVTYYGKGFDIPMLNTRLLKWHQEPIEKRHHLDMFYSLKSNLLTARKSQSHLLSWLGTPEQKMSVSADTWADAAINAESLKILTSRCESDVEGLEALYERTKHLCRDLKK